MERAATFVVMMILLFCSVIAHGCIGVPSQSELQDEGGGYRSRAAYKLKQINARFRVIRSGDMVVDLGAAPDGWLQMALKLSGSTVISVDIRLIRSIDGVITIRGDITAGDAPYRVKQLTSGAYVMLCDAAPNLSGDWSYAHARSIDPAEHALTCTEQILRSGGNSVVKAFHGDLFSGYLQSIRLRFRNVRAQTHTSSQRSFVGGTDGLTRRQSRDNHRALRQEAVFSKNLELWIGVPTVYGINTFIYPQAHWSA